MRRPLPLTLRRLLAGAAVVVLVGGGFSAGALASGLARPSYRAVALVALPDPGSGPALPTDVLSPTVVLRADGLLVGLTAGGYTQVQLPGAPASELFATLAASSGGWASAYPLPGLRATGRVELRLVGASSRTIAIDNPLQNTELPDSLFELVATLLRPAGVDPSGGLPVAPPALRVRTLPAAAGADETAGAGPAPAWLDPTAAGGPAGQLLGGGAVTAAASAWPALVHLRYPDNTALVTLNGTTLRLAWGADWTTWIEGVK